MREHIASVCALVLAILLSTVARAQPGCAVCGVWAIEQVYSNADGSIQFLMVQSARYDAGHFVAQQLAGQTLIASDGVTERRISFTTEIPDVTNRPILIATREFADLGLIKPDYIMPAGFLSQRNGSLRLRDSSWYDRDILLYNALPTDGKAALYMDIDGDYTDIATATNNAGASYRFTQSADNSFRMTAIFSDQAGLFQYIQLEERSGKHDQNHFAGLTLEVTSHGGVYKSITFPSDLPSTDTAWRPVLLGTTHVGLPQTDFELPEGFLPTDGGTLVFAGVDVWDYPQLPANGYTVVRRDGGLTSNPSFFAGLVFRPFTGFPTGLLVPMDPVVLSIVERAPRFQSSIHSVTGDP
jgi:hypothetical protein